MNFDFKQLLAFLVVVIASIGGSIIATNVSNNNTRNLDDRITTKNRIALARADEARDSALRLVCKRGVADRVITVKLRKVQAISAQAVADDPSQPPLTRKIRANEARELRASIKDMLPRLDKAHGGTLDCNHL